MAADITDVLRLYPPAEFAGLTFPYNTCDIEGSLDHHVHKFIHRPGGEVEDLARHLYTIRFSCDFTTTLKTFRDAYPKRLGELITVFEKGGVHDLVIPNHGTMRALCTNWPRNLTWKIRNGEKVNLTFLESSPEQFTFNNVLGPSASSLSSQYQSLVVAAVTANGDPIAALAGFKATLEKMKDAIDVVLGWKDEADVVSDYVTSNIEAVLGACEELDSFAPLKDPANALLADALMTLWATATEFAGDQLQQDQIVDSIVTDRIRTITDLAVEFYGDPSRALELLQLNNFAKAGAIPPSTLVLYYTAA
jgi:prophage DNA circulation protein